MFHCPLRLCSRMRFMRLCLYWVRFADRVASNIIATAYDQRSLSILNWVFQGRRSLPVEHYLDRCSTYAAAVLLAAVLHFVIVLFICGIFSRRKQLQFEQRFLPNRGQGVSNQAIPLGPACGMMKRAGPFGRTYTVILRPTSPDQLGVIRESGSS